MSRGTNGKGRSWMKLIDDAANDIREVGRACGREEMVKLIASPCGYPPGTCYKIALLAMRYEAGVTLWHDQDDESRVMRETTKGRPKQALESTKAKSRK